MTTKIFDIDAEWEGNINGVTILFTGKIELDQRILDAVDDDWRAHIYNLKTEQEIAEHIAYNLIVNDAEIWQLDGWADQPKDVICRIV